MKKKRHKNILIGVTLFAMVITLGVIVILTTDNQKECTYYGETINRHPYYLHLQRDGTFDFVDPVSSRITFHNEGDRYRWNDGMLELTFADSDKVWYFRQEGDSLVFDGSLSVLMEGDPRLDKVVFEERQE